jgi:hypothetical protein
MKTVKTVPERPALAGANSIAEVKAVKKRTTIKDTFHFM